MMMGLRNFWREKMRPFQRYWHKPERLFAIIEAKL